MEKHLAEDEAMLLLGKGPQEAAGYLKENGYCFCQRYTYHEKDKYNVEERVIRIMQKKEEIEVLVGYFQMPQYI